MKILVKTFNKNKKVMYMAGCHIRYDAASKCTLVEQLLPLRETDKDKYLEAIEIAATVYKVSPPTIKAWVKKYQDTCTTVKTALPGTYGVSNTVITKKKDINLIRAKLDKIKSELELLVSSVETSPNSSKPAKQTKNNAKQSLDLIDELNK